MNNPFTNSFNASRFNSVANPHSGSQAGGMQETDDPSNQSWSQSVDVNQRMNERFGYGWGGFAGSNSQSSSRTGGGSQGGSQGGSGGQSGGTTNQPYADMPAWLQQYYGAGGNNNVQPGSDGYFTSGQTLQDILYGEAGRMQGAADRHFDRTLAREDEWGSFLGGIQGRYEDSRVSTGVAPEDYASVRRAEQEYNAFADRTAQDISSTVAGYQAQFQNQIDSVNNGMRTDGSMMTAQEQADMRFAIDQNMAVGRQQAVTTIMSNYSQQKSALGMQVAGMIGQAEQHSQQGRIVDAANQMNALQLENAGRGAYANFTLNNPETVVSVLGGLMALNEQGAAMSQLFGSQGNNANQGLYSQYLRDQNQDNNRYGSGPGTATRWYNDQSFEQWLEQNGGGYG
jgi:hypothetical protein